MPSRASTSTSPFRNGVTRAVNAPLNISLLQFEACVEATDRLLHPIRRYNTCYLYLRGRDHPYRDVGLAQSGKHPRSVAGTVEHPGPDDRDLAEPLLALDLAAQGGSHLASEPPRFGEVA